MKAAEREHQHESHAICRYRPLQVPVLKETQFDEHKCILFWFDSKQCNTARQQLENAPLAGRSIRGFGMKESRPVVIHPYTQDPCSRLKERANGVNEKPHDSVRPMPLQNHCMQNHHPFSGTSERCDRLTNGPSDGEICVA